MNPTLVVFAREPTPGRVKSRLAADIGPEAACMLHRRMLARTLRLAARYARLRGVNARCDIDDPDRGGSLAAHATRLGLAVGPQAGADLGERMRYSLERALANGGRAVLVGTDCPSLSASVLDRAFDALARAPAVIVPSLDGGYVLVGLDRPQPALFSDIDWGTDRVAEQTRERAAALRIGLAELAPLPDVDVVGDVDRWLGAQWRSRIR